MSKATLAFGGEITEANLRRLIEALCYDHEPVTAEEFTAYPGDEPPAEEDECPAWYEEALRQASTEGRPFVLTNWAGEAVCIDATHRVLFELKMPCRRFAPAHLDHTNGELKESGFTVLHLPDASPGAWVQTDTNGVPMIQLDADTMDLETEQCAEALLEAAASAWQLRHMPLPPLKIIP